MSFDDLAPSLKNKEAVVGNKKNKKSGITQRKLYLGEFDDFV